MAGLKKALHESVIRPSTRLQGSLTAAAVVGAGISTLLQGRSLSNYLVPARPPLPKVVTEMSETFEKAVKLGLEIIDELATNPEFRKRMTELLLTSLKCVKLTEKVA